MKKIKSLGLVLITILIYYIGQFAVGLIVGIGVGLKSAFSGEDLNILLNEATPNILIYSGITSTLLVLLFIFLRKIKVKEYLRVKKISIDVTAKIAAYGVFLNLFISSVLFFVINFIDLGSVGDNYIIMMNDIFTGNLLLLFISVVVVAPIAEEIILRGVVLNELRASMSILVVVLIQAFLFGFIHLNYIQGVYAGLFGIVLGYAYIKYDSLLIPIALHMSFNLIGFLSSIYLTPNVFIISILCVIGAIGTSLLTYHLLLNDTKRNIDNYESDEFVIS
jgi:membrane protease YdiL (CAAX protease family)